MFLLLCSEDSTKFGMDMEPSTLPLPERSMGVCGWILFAQDSLSNQSASWGKGFLQHPSASPTSALEMGQVNADVEGPVQVPLNLIPQHELIS